MNNEIILNGGCEYRTFKNAINMDISYNSNADIIADLEHIPIRNKIIKYINLIAVLEHVESPIRILRELKRVIINNGIIKIGIPNIHTISRITWNLKAPLDYHSSDPSDNVNGFDTIILNNLFRLTGFKSLKFEYFEDSYFWKKHKSFFRFILFLIPKRLKYRGLIVIGKSESNE